MPQLLSLEYNDTEARMVVANPRGDRVVIEQAFSVSLAPEGPGDSEESVDVGGRIAAALAARGVGRIDALVAVDRSSIELRQLSLPPSPDDELPEIVRFQAMREFNELTEDWLLDFVPLEQTEPDSLNVLAAAIDPKLVAQIRKTCDTAHARLQRLVLRPCAAASLLARSRPEATGRLTLLVNLLAEEADLTATVGGQAVFLRTARLGGDPLAGEGQSAALLAEMRRTIAAVQNQLSGQRVESIVLLGGDDAHAALAKQMGEALKLPTELFDPFAGLQLGRELSGAPPERPGRFAPLLGMALAELESTGHVIDFLHPRRRPAPPSKRRMYTGIAVALAVLVVGYFGRGWYLRYSLKAENDRLVIESKELDEDVKAAAVALASVDSLQQWEATDVVWLDELRELSEDFPAAKDAMLQQLTARAEARLGGKMKLVGLAANASAVGRVATSLHDATHKVVGEGSGVDGSNPFYKLQFASSVKVEPPTAASKPTAENTPAPDNPAPENKEGQ